MRGTIADVSWATWLVDYDLGHRWALEEGEVGAHLHAARYEKVRLFQLNPDLVAWAMYLTSTTNLKDRTRPRPIACAIRRQVPVLPAVKTAHT